MKIKWGKFLSCMICLVLLVVVLAQPAQAACDHSYEDGVCVSCGQIGGTCGTKLTWSYDPDKGVLHIEGSGAMTAYTITSHAPWHAYRHEIKSVVMNKEITSIGAYAFYECSGLKSITIPEKTSTVATSAFYKCDNLEWIETDSENDKFSMDEFGVLYNQTKTTLVAVPGSLRGEYEISSKVTSVTTGAFSYAKYVSAIRVDENNTKYSSDENGLLYNKSQKTLVVCPRAFEGDCQIPKTVTKYNTDAFTDCMGLTGIFVEEGNETYSSTGEGVLLNAAGTKILLCPAGYTGVCTFPATVTSYDAKAFAQCSGLAAFQVEEGSTKYSHDEAGMLRNLAGTSITLCPNGYTGNLEIPVGVSVSTSAFRYVSGLTAFSVEEGHKSYSADEEGVLYNKAKTNLVLYPAGKGGVYEIPDTVKTLGANAFYGSNVTEVVLPDALTTIGDACFYQCYDLKDLEFPETLTKIGSSAFAYCGSLRSLSLPEEMTSIGSSAFAYCAGLQKVDLPQNLTSLSSSTFRECNQLSSVQIPDSVTSIGDYCFYRCYPLEDQKIPSGLTKVGKYAFTYCYNQSSAVLPETVTEVGDYAFADCPSLETAVIPEGVTTLTGVFQRCTNLTSVTLPDSLEKIGDYCFQYCSKLEDVQMPATIGSLGQYAFAYCSELQTLQIPAGVEKLGNYLLRDCKMLTEVSIPDSVTAIGDYCFYQCKELVKADIPDGVKEIGKYAFYKCEKLENIQIPSTLEEMGSYGFAYCHQLRDVVIPETLTELPSNAFRLCENLENVSVPDTLLKIGDYAFYECKKMKQFDLPNQLQEIGKYAFWFCNQLESAVIPESVVKVGNSAFRYCENLQRAVIPGTIQGGDFMFYDCEKLTDVTLGEGLPMIPEYMFYNCSTLPEIKIPESVTEIGTCAFKYCRSLKEIVLPEKVLMVGVLGFEDCEALERITLPAALEYVGEAAFRNTPLRDVLYGGTEKQWNKITVDMENAPLAAASVHYEAGKVDKHELSEVTEAPTCTEQGGTYRVCTCGLKETLSTTEPIGHAYTSAVTKEATCVELGVLTYTCANDANHTYTEDIPLTDHTPEKIPGVAPTCTETGLTEGEKCSLCQKVLTEQKEVEPLGHIGGKATCIAQAVCSRCETSYGELDAKNHSGEEVKDAVAPTCGAEGYSGDIYCSGCGEKLEAGESVPPTGKHTYETKVVAPTAIEKGYTIYTCKVCGHSYEDNYKNPTGLVAPQIQVISTTSGKPTLTWEAMEEGIEFEVYRATSKSGEYDELGMTGENIFVDTSAKMGKTYYYQVRSVYGNKISGSSNIVKATCKCGQPALKLSTTASSGKVKLSWGKISSAKKYEVYRSTKETSGFKKLTSTTKTYYTDSSAKVGTTYYYKVITIGSKSSYNSDYSQTLKGIRICGQTDLAVKLNSSTGKPDLSWDKVSGASKYLVYRATEENGQYTLIKTTTGTSYKDTKAEADKDYYYRVNAIGSKSGTESVPEKAIKVHTTCAAPSISVKNDKASGDPVISWKAVEGAVKYKVYRSSKSGSGFKSVGTTEELSFRDTSASTGKKYYYKVKAVCESGASSSYSSVKSGYSKCAAPEVEITLSGKKPKLTWSKASGAKKYEVYRSTKATSGFKKIKTTSSTKFTDSSAKKGKTYYYKVKVVASTSSANSDYSNVVSMKSK